MVEPRTFVDVLVARARCTPTTIAFTFLAGHGDATGQTITYAELDRRARVLAGALVQRGLAGQPVLLLYTAGIDYIGALLACFYAGAIAVPAYPPGNTSVERVKARVLAIVADAGVRLALTNTAVLDACLELAALRGVEVLTTDGPELESASWGDDLPGVGPEAPCVLQYTSGSTAAPKGVLLRQRQLIANQKALQATRLQLAGGECVTWLPPYHDMGLMGFVLHPLYAGMHTTVFAPETFLRRPLVWLQSIMQTQATITGAPNFAFDLCVRRIAPDERAGLDLSCLQVVYNGAEPIHPATLDAFCAAFEPHGFRREAFYPCYGMAESTLIISGGDVAAPPVVRAFSHLELRAGRGTSVSARSADTIQLVGCGRALAGEKIVIVDPDRIQVLPDGRVGEIWVSGPSVADGYWNRPEETQATFGARLGVSGEGPFLRTGDLGFLDGGELFVTGRLKDLIIVHGQNHYPHDIERSMQGVDAALVAGCGAAFCVEVEREERLVLVQEVDHRLQPDLQALLQRVPLAIREHHDLAVHALVLIKKGSLPKTSSGKLQRRATKTAYLRGQLQVRASWQTGSASADSAGAQPRAEQVASDTSEAPPPDRTLTRLLPRERQSAAITSFLKQALAAKAQVHENEIDEHAPLAQYGVDSIFAAELAEKLERWLQIPLPTTISYDNPTIAALTSALCARLGAPPDNVAASPGARMPQRAVRQREAIAIVGMACRFPGANDLRSFWDVLRNGVDTIQEVPASRWDNDALYDPSAAAPGKLSSRWGGFIEGIDLFDPHFFGISPREAASMDPQQRVFLEVAWEALEDAAIAPSSLTGSDTGVFAGVCSNDYGLLYGGDLALVDAGYGTGNAPSVVPNRLSYFLDLKGPSMAIDTACSSALVALRAACQSLAQGETDLCIVGGVNAVLAPEPGVFYSKARCLAADGRCKTFDATADGFVRSEGCGVVVIKRLSQAQSDGDRIYALVVGSAVNHHGASNGLMAPSGPAEEQVIRRALAEAELRPDELDYVEAHGVGTPLADAIELRALGAVMQGRSADHPCLVGSVKTNLGHLEAASGMASLIKTALCLSHEEIPPHLHLHDVHPDIGLEDLPLAIPTVPTAFRRGERARFAGVSAFGFGGSNAHVILREAPLASTPRSEPERPVHLLALSAHDPRALHQLAARFARQPQRPALADLCYTANTGRSPFNHRAAFVAESHEELRAALTLFSERASDLPQAPCRRDPRIALLFTQAAVPAGSARMLYETQPDFRQAFDHASHVVAPYLQVTLTDLLFAPDAVARSAALAVHTDTVLVALHYALYTLLRRFGISPCAVLGQGVGEYAAAAASGVLEWEDALRLATLRAELVRSLTPHANVGMTLRRFEAELERIDFRAPVLPFIAGSLGHVFDAETVPGPAHWVGHFYHVAGCDDGIDALLPQEPDACVELNATSTYLLGSTRPFPRKTWFSTLEEPGRDYHTLLQTLAALYVQGANLDFRAFDAPYERRKVPLPTYPFQRVRCWLDFPARGTTSEDSESVPVRSSHPLLQRMRTSAPPRSGFVPRRRRDETG